MANNKEPQNRQDHFIHFRVTEEEFLKLKQSGELYNLSPSSYAKKLALKSKLRKALFDFDATNDFRVELSRQGNNLNQVASRLNQLAKNNNDPDIINAFRYTYSMLQTAQKEWYELWQRLVK
jgi:hypothetical protein